MKTEDYLFRAMPRFPWRRPVKVDRTPLVRRRDFVGKRVDANPPPRTQYACRVCWGLGDTSETFNTLAAHAAHVLEEHPDAPEQDRMSA